jgi:hypothetical protein
LGSFIACLSSLCCNPIDCAWNDTHRRGRNVEHWRSENPKTWITAHVEMLNERDHINNLNRITRYVPCCRVVVEQQTIRSCDNTEVSKPVVRNSIYCSKRSRSTFHDLMNVKDNTNDHWPLPGEHDHVMAVGTSKPKSEVNAGRSCIITGSPAFRSGVSERSSQQQDVNTSSTQRPSPADVHPLDVFSRFRSKQSI